MPRLIARIRNPARRASGVALLASLAACGGPGEEAAAAGPEPVLVSAADLATAGFDVLQTGPVLAGSLEPATIVRLEAQATGTVADLRVDRGTPVRRGQVVAVIDAEGVRGRAASAEAAVAAARANAALVRQRREAARRLHETGAISKLELDAAEAALEAAEAELAAARAQSAVAGEEASRTIIRSPITGVVSDRLVEQGEAVSPGTPMVTIVNTQRLELAGQVPVEQAAQVRVGQPVEFTLPAYPEREFRGTVARIDPRADPQTRQVGVYVQLPNPGDSVIAGQFARGRVLGQQREALVIPEAAVRTAGAETWVLVVERDTVQRRPVTLGARDLARGLVEVRTGLSSGARVLAVPNAQIAEGTPVTIAGAGEEAAPPLADTTEALRPGKGG